MMVWHDNKQACKLCYYSNINGQEQRIEKEFESVHDMDEFIQTHKLPAVHAFAPAWNFSPWAPLPQMDTWFEDFFDRKLATRALPAEWSLADLRAEKARIEQEESQKAKRRSLVQQLLDEAKELKAFFESRKDKARADQAQAKITEYEKELA